MITQEQLKKSVVYDPKTGKMYRLRGKKFAGTLANGYIGITVLGHRDYVHRLAVLYMTGEYPHGQIVDHINGDKTDNRWSNLQILSPSLNVAKGKTRTDNLSGCKGVFYNSNCGKNPWLAYINRNGVRKYIGYYKSREEAINARKREEETLHV